MAGRLDDRLILLLLYLLSFWPLLVNNGIYWDDWVLYDQASRTLQNMFHEMASPIAARLDMALVTVPPVFAKWFVFLVCMLSMLTLYQVLVSTSLFDRYESLLLTLFSTLMPYNFARATAICAVYSLCYLAFLLAMLSLVTYLANRRVVYRAVSLVLFFLSFTTNSLLLYYVIVLIYIACRGRKSVRSLSSVARRLLAYSDFVLVPIVFFVSKALFYVPSGIYADYNTIRLHYIERSPKEFMVTLWSSFGDVIWKSLASAAGALVPWVLLMVGTYWVLGGREGERSGGVLDERERPGLRFWLGALLFFAGVLPYLAVGREGAGFGSSWESRDQLLLGVGAAFMLYYGLRYLSTLLRVGVQVQRLMFAILIAAFVLTNATTYLKFQADWFKQVSFIENVKDIPAAKDNTTFMVDDRAGELDAMGRRIQFYEYNGMLKRAFGTETRLAARALDFGVLSSPDFLESCVKRPQYNFRDHVYSAPTHTIIIEPGVREVGFMETVRLLAKELFRPAAFRADVKDVLTVRVEPVDEALDPAP